MRYLQRIWLGAVLVGWCVFFTSFIGDQPKTCKPVDWVSAWALIFILSSVAVVGFIAGRESKGD